jgi:hypothetical protein
MPNSIRTPRQGVTANSQRIAKAVDDEEWQAFRLSLKGKSTHEKLIELDHYWINTPHADGCSDPHEDESADCDVCIRLDNYIKALCRGGQLVAGQSIKDACTLEHRGFTFLALEIKRN